MAVSFACSSEVLTPMPSPQSMISRTGGAEGLLMTLQKEYLDLIESCVDDTFYPDALGNLYPSERFSLYRYFQDLPTTARRTETVSVSVYSTDRWVMPYGMPPEKSVRGLQNVPEPIMLLWLRSWE